MEEGRPGRWANLLGGRGGLASAPAQEAVGRGSRSGRREALAALTERLAGGFDLAATNEPLSGGGDLGGWRGSGPAGSGSPSPDLAGGRRWWRRRPDGRGKEVVVR